MHSNHQFVTDPNSDPDCKSCDECNQPKSRHIQSRVINRAYCREWALDYARTNRSHKFTRVSEEFLNAIEAATKAAIKAKIHRAPSKGVTLK